MEENRNSAFSILKPPEGWHTLPLVTLQNAGKERKISDRARKIIGADGKKRNPGKGDFVNILNSFETGVPLDPVVAYWTNHCWARLASCMTEMEICEEVLTMYDCAS